MTKGSLVDRSGAGARRLDSDNQLAAPSLRRLTRVPPLLPPLSSVVYEYIMSELTSRTRAALRDASSRGDGIYHASKTHRNGASHHSTEKQVVRVYEAAQLVSAVYSRSLDPLRFRTSAERPSGKEQVFERFAHALRTDKLRTAVELVAADLDLLWKLDAHQAGAGANTVRWMQYLAGEVLETRLLEGESTPQGLSPALHAALSAISESVTVPDRFTALAHRAEVAGAQTG